MKLPNWKNAYIPSEKLTGYLLSESHSIGKSKAKFFRAIGFNEANTDVLKHHLISIAQSEDVTEVVSTARGIKYVLDGFIQSSRGNLKIRTVWIIEKGQDRPRFVTAYPA